MKQGVWVSALMLASAIAWGQPPQSADNRTPSLGAVARQLRADRAETGKKQVKVFTNDNLPPPPAGQGLTAASGISPAPSPTPQVQPESGAATKRAAGEVHNEEYYREEKAKIGATMEIHRRELAVLQQKSSQGDMQYYPDPNKTLQQEYSRSDINKLNDQTEKKKQQIAADERALDDLRDQLRREGGDPGWLR